MGQRHLLVTKNYLTAMFGPIELNRTLQYFNLINQKVDEIDEHRCFWCIFYELCLKIAALKNWRSFTCKYCPNFLVDGDSVRGNILIH
jgi:hypothetical protein